ncbi:MAG: type II toxin-antitoxin system prevent-host-death family antitoxin [Candidatus Nealsonbacteria bacterium]
MDLNEIKKLIEEDGGRIIIVENGEPVMVVVSFADYKKGRGKSESRPKENNPKPPSVDRRALPVELSSEELKIEDLPF